MRRNHNEIPERWQKLMDEGWVNITGLPVYKSFEGLDVFRGIILPQPNLQPGIGHNNGMSVAYLPDGTVWLKAGLLSLSAKSESMTDGAFVPYSNGEFISARNVLERVADPFWHGAEATDCGKPGNPSLGYFERPATLEELQEHPEFKRNKKLANS